MNKTANEMLEELRKLILKYDKALETACCNVVDLQKQIIELRGHFYTDGRKRTLRDNSLALKEFYLKESGE